MSRWLEPGGRVALAVWDDYASNPWHGIPREIVARRINERPVPASAPGPVRYADPAQFVSVLQRAGFGDITLRSWDGTLQLGGGLPAPQAARFALSAFWGNALPPTHPLYDSALRELTQRFRLAEFADAVTLAARAHIVTGRRV